MARPAVSETFSFGLKANDQSTIDVEKFCLRFGLSDQEVASLSGVHQEAAVDAPSNERLQNFMQSYLHVVSAAAKIAGDDERAVYWMRNTPIPDFGDRFAMDLVAEGKTESVVKYLQSIDSGFSG